MWWNRWPSLPASTRSSTVIMPRSCWTVSVGQPTRRGGNALARWRPQSGIPLCIPRDSRGPTRGPPRRASANGSPGSQTVRSATTGARLYYWGRVDHVCRILSTNGDETMQSLTRQRIDEVKRLGLQEATRVFGSLEPATGPKDDLMPAPI